MDTPEIDVDQLAVARPGVVLDVRERAEFVEGHVPGAVLVPMGQLPAHMVELDRERDFYVICASGNRSSAMTDLLRAAGFDRSPWPGVPMPGSSLVVRSKGDCLDHGWSEHCRDRDSEPG